METEQMIQLIEAVASSGLTEFVYRSGDVHLTLKTQPQVIQQTVAAPAAAETSNVDEHWVTSPLVGTFYCAPQEDADPYVKVGDQVTKGQTIGIIETMKLMNELEADRDGVISEIAVENEQVVEFGQLLFRIE